ATKAVTTCVVDAFKTDAPRNAKERFKRSFSLSVLTMACAALVACGGGGGGSAGVADAGGVADSGHTAPVSGSEPGVSQPGTSLDLIGTSVGSPGFDMTIPSKGTNVGGTDSSGSGSSTSDSSTPDSGSLGGAVKQVDYTARPFSADSPWNAPIPANATYRESDARTKSLRGSAAFGVNSSQWTIWVWKAKETDPLVTVNVSVHNLTTSSKANAGDV